MKDILFGFFIGSLFDCFCNLMVEPIRRRWRKECKYNCSNCRVWDCGRHLCIQQKKKYERNEKENEQR